MNCVWRAVPERLKLLANEIHVFKANLVIDPALETIFWATLSADEKTRANRFRFPIHRAYFIAGRGILRRLLGQYLNVLPQDLQFEYEAQGKPFLVGFSNFKFNISHSKHHILLAFSQKKTIGVDVEVIDPKIEFEVIAPRFFSKNEATTLLALPRTQQPAVFYNCWTRKEAFIKAKGGGLSIPLDQFEVTLLPEDAPKLLAINWAMEEVDNWELFSFHLEKNVVGALIVEGKVDVHFLKITN
jgi:4'-phosphopantetheinyl transferase